MPANRRHGCRKGIRSPYRVGIRHPYWPRRIIPRGLHVQPTLSYADVASLISTTFTSMHKTPSRGTNGISCPHPVAQAQAHIEATYATRHQGEHLNPSDDGRIAAYAMGQDRSTPGCLACHLTGKGTQMHRLRYCTFKSDAAQLYARANLTYLRRERSGSIRNGCRTPTSCLANYNDHYTSST